VISLLKRRPPETPVSTLILIAVAATSATATAAFAILAMPVLRQLKLAIDSEVELKRMLTRQREEYDRALVELKDSMGLYSRMAEKRHKSQENGQSTTPASKEVDGT
jgi:hypothetical protein